MSAVLGLSVILDGRRDRFTVFVWMANEDVSIDIKAKLAGLGYQAFALTDQPTLLERIKVDPPHLLVFDAQALATPMSDFVEAVLTQAPETQFICVAGPDQADAVMDYREYNFVGFVPHMNEKLAERCVWAVDQACETLYLAFMNEKLLTENTKLSDELEIAFEGNKQMEVEVTSRRSVSIEQKLALYQNCQSKEDVLVEFFKHLEMQAQQKDLGVKGVFFKFLPTVQSLVATSALGLDLENMKGVGEKISDEELAALKEPKTVHLVPASLQKVLSENFAVDRVNAKPLFLFKDFDGLVVLWGSFENEIPWREDFAVFQIFYQQAHLLKRNQGLDIYDGATELFNRNYFYRKLDEEMSRAKRLEKPLSLVRLSIDHLAEIEQSMGKVNRDLVMKAVANVIRKTSRVNDMCFRTDESQISILLPHTGKKGAALRAERIRRLVEGQSFSMSGLHITISLGVSEYPTLVRLAEELDQTASQALDFVYAKGGNRVCLYKPVTEIEPDFEVSADQPG